MLTKLIRLLHLFSSLRVTSWFASLAAYGNVLLRVASLCWFFFFSRTRWMVLASFPGLSLISTEFIDSLELILRRWCGYVDEVDFVDLFSLCPFFFPLVLHFLAKLWSLRELSWFYQCWWRDRFRCCIFLRLSNIVTRLLAIFVELYWWIWYVLASSFLFGWQACNEVIVHIGR